MLEAAYVFFKANLFPRGQHSLPPLITMGNPEAIISKRFVSFMRDPFLHLDTGAYSEGNEITCPVETHYADHPTCRLCSEIMCLWALQFAVLGRANSRTYRQGRNGDSGQAAKILRQAYSCSKGKRAQCANRIAR